MAKSSRRPDPFDRPLDACLERLRVHGIPYRPDFAEIDRWIARCPVCADELLLHEPYRGSAITVRCGGGCHESRIVEGLAAAPRRPDEGLDIAEQASDIAHNALELLERSWR
jgi:hypothetical protein